MDETEALALVASSLNDEYVGDDCAAVPFGDTNAVLTTDMLHETTDFPDGTTDRVVGWRSVAVSLSDLASSGAHPIAVVVAYGAPEFDDSLEGSVSGAREVCETCSAEYVGGDLDRHDERTVVSTALGRTDEPVGRDGADAGNVVAVTGELGRTAVALRKFENGNVERANRLFAFEPRTEEGVGLAPYTTAMTDLSDGITVGLHNLAEASVVGFDVERDELPLHKDADKEDVFVGEDYELLCTLPPETVEEARDAVGETGLTVVGECVRREGVRMDGEPLERRGYEH